jgi:MFS transporter, DHA1 family, solute carrier family 18 (vesicular amine transporter), member 1/2
LGLIISTPIGGVLYGQLGYRAPFVFGIGAACVDLVGRLLIIEQADADTIRAKLSEEAVEEAQEEARDSHEAVVTAPAADDHVTSAAEVQLAPSGELPIKDDTADSKDDKIHPTHLPPWKIWLRLGISRRPVSVGLVTLLLGYAHAFSNGQHFSCSIQNFSVGN